MHLTELGWNPFFEKTFFNEQIEECVPARVSEENKGFYRVLSEQGEFLAQIAGKVRYQAEDRRDYPAVGDWVAITPRPLESRATIVAILPRQTILSRKIAGRSAQEQILATNLNTVFVVTSLNREFNIRRIERYLTLVWESGAKPVVLLSKADLCDEQAIASEEVECVAPGISVHPVSAITGTGLESVRQYLLEGQTAALIGSSGVGKSTIINALSTGTHQRVQAIRLADDRGRHTTTSRQMILLPDGGVVIDTPGMRELQLWESDTGLARVFDDLETLAKGCRFRDCHHQGEPDCAVAEAIEHGQLPAERFENYRKMEAELRFLETKTNVWSRQAVKARAKRACKAQKRNRILTD